jgi:hypothetical protein
MSESNANPTLSVEEKIEILAYNLQEQQGHVFYLTNLVHTILDILTDDLFVDKDSVKERLRKREELFAQAVREAKEAIETESVSSEPVTSTDASDLIV